VTWALFLLALVGVGAVKAVRWSVRADSKEKPEKPKGLDLDKAFVDEMKEIERHIEDLYQ
jgi:hypothetical protein